MMVYVDPSPRGEWALELARQVSTSWATRVHLVATREDVAAFPQLLSRARQGIAGIVAETARPGPAERAVVEEAVSRPWGLVIVPLAGRGALARMLRGSRVATVVRAVRAPVLVARRPGARVDRVLAALSGRRSTEAVVDAALEWEQRTGARASFVHVSAEVPVGTPVEAAPRARPRPRAGPRPGSAAPAFGHRPPEDPRWPRSGGGARCVRGGCVRAARGWRPQRGRRRLRPRGRHRASAARLSRVDARRPGQRPCRPRRVLTAGALFS